MKSLGVRMPDPKGIMCKIRRGAYHTRGRRRKAFSRYHRAMHAHFRLVDAPAIRAWIAENGGAQ